MDPCTPRRVLTVHALWRLLLALVLAESGSGAGPRLQLVNEPMHFMAAQRRCEELGGHLAYLSDPSAQALLQTILDPDRDVWIGLGRSANGSTGLTDSCAQDLLETVLNAYEKNSIGLEYGANWTTDHGFFWLDGYPLTFSVWVVSPDLSLNPGLDPSPVLNPAFSRDPSLDPSLDPSPVLNPALTLDPSEDFGANRSYGPDCGLVLGSSGLRWAVTSDCERRLPFICQYGSFHSVWTVNQNPSLSCGPGEVLVLDQLYFIQNQTKANCSSASLLLQLTALCSGRSSCSLPQQTLSLCSASGTRPRLLYHCSTVQNVTVLRCYSGSRSFSPHTCSTLYGQSLDIEVTSVTDMDVWVTNQSLSAVTGLLSAVTGILSTVTGNLSAVTGLSANHSANITVPMQLLQTMGPGCHSLQLHNRINDTLTEQTTDFKVCVWLPLVRLKVLALEANISLGLLALNVSVDQGNPAQILFYLRTWNWTFVETRVLKNPDHIYYFRHNTRDVEHVRVVAVNTFSSLETVEEICLYNYTTTNFSKLSLCGYNGSAPGMQSCNNNTGSGSNNSGSGPKKPKPTSSSSSTTKRKKSTTKAPQTTESATTTKTTTSSPTTSTTTTKPTTTKPATTKPTTTTAKPTTTTTTTTTTTSPTTTTMTTTTTTSTTTTPSLYLNPYYPYYPYYPHYPHPYYLNPYYPHPKPHLSIHHPFHIHPLKPNHHPYLHHIKHHHHHHHHTPPCHLHKHHHHHRRPVSPCQLHSKHFVHHIHHSHQPSAISTYIPPPTPISPNTYIPPATFTPMSFSPGLHCSFTPLQGTTLQIFTISCTTQASCPNFKFCYRTLSGKSLGCSSRSPSSLFLPPGDPHLSINITATNGAFRVSTVISVEVSDVPACSSLESLQASVMSSINLLQSQGQLTAEALGQLLSSVGLMLNSRTDPEGLEQRRKFREVLLMLLLDVLLKSSVSAECPGQIHALVSGLIAVIQTPEGLSTTAQEKASDVLLKLSSRLIQTLVCPDFQQMLFPAAESTILAANILLGFSSESVAADLMVALQHAQTALLQGSATQTEPTVVSQSHVAVMVHRVTPEQLQTQVSVPDGSGPWFDLQSLPLELFEDEPLVDVRMMTLQKNPFSWNLKGNVSAPFVSLELTTTSGSRINVRDLSREVQIFFPNPKSEKLNSTVLDLGNFSTIILHLPPGQTSLIIKMVPSEEPLPFYVYLGQTHPSDSEPLAMTQMPHHADSLEHRYTWLLGEEDLKGICGQMFLVVRPLVGPGVKSIKASLSVTPFTTTCSFWNQSLQEWSSAGCRAGPLTSPAVTQCLCDHLTVFGSSFFVVPNLVDPSRSAELFGTFTENPVVVSLVVALFLAYILALIWARYKDLRDTAKVKVTALADNDPLDRHQYLVTVKTGFRRGAATSSQVTLVLMGSSGSSAPHHLSDSRKLLFQRGATDMFILKTSIGLGHLQGIRLWHSNSGAQPSWFVSSVVVQDLQTGEKFHVLCNSWISVDLGDDGLDQYFPVSTDEELQRFSHLFLVKITRDFCDGHLWYSVVNRPPSSTFTRVQRLSCCFSLLLCTMLTSIMFYGIPTDPSEQVMDLGHFEFTWQQFMVGVQSSLIMFPINILIVSLFRFSRPRTNTCCGSYCAPETCCLAEFCCGPSLGRSKPDQKSVNRITKKVSKLVQSLSKSNHETKSKSRMEMRLEKDLGSVLSELEDYIIQRNLHRAQRQASGRKAGKCREDSLFSELCRLENQLSSEEESDLQRTEGRDLQRTEGRDLQRTEGRDLQRKEGRDLQRTEGRDLQSTEGRDLQRTEGHDLQRTEGHDLQRTEGRDLQRTDGRDLQRTEGRDLQRTGGLVVSSYSRALLWIRELKERLSDESASVQSSSLLSPPPRLRLPWWCVLLGWLLVVGSSCVCGYFTMLYGLKFGKEKSISWLVSMVVSFFQSLLVIQPLKVVGLALFFALVMKKMEEEEMVNVYIYHDIGWTQRNLSVYEPPPAVDVERMRRNQLKEKKAYALLMEIFVYLCFLWMLLLVAYGQRDQNAFYLNQHVLESFRPRPGPDPSLSLGQVFSWTRTTLLPNLYGPHPGFITDGNSKLVGVARLRQVRVRGPSCLAPDYVHFQRDCNPPYSWYWEDTGSYGPRWTPSDNRSDGGPWTYRSQDELRASPVWGHSLLYRGGGYVAELGPDRSNATSTLQYLYSERWLDSRTRAVFAEFTVYNANVNLFCLATLLFETRAAGAFEFVWTLQTLRLYSSTGGLHAFVMAGEILYIIFILYYMYKEGKAMREQRWSYFRNKWNLVELSIIALSWTGVGLFIQRSVLGQRDIEYFQNNKDKFPSFHSTALSDAALQYVVAFLVLLSTVKLWHLLRLNPNMNLISSALSRAAGDISGFLLVIVLLLIAFASACNTLYGWQMASYRTFSDSLITLIKLQLGIFNYAEVLDYSPVLGAFLVGSCIILMGFVVLNLLISVILVAFQQEQIHHQASEEEEIVQMMLKKVFGLFGISYTAPSTEQQEERTPAPEETPQRPGET